LEVVFGAPAEEIAQFAQRDQSELIVLPSHGRTGLARLMIGSVAERVVRLAHCPVLVLRN
jgi:nucleotide-binding universal stress UspA family protein